MKRNDIVTFTNIDNKMLCSHNLLFSYFVADIDWDRQYVQIKPLTIGFLLESTIRNNTKMLYWYFINLLWKTGFIDMPECERFSWKYFRLAFWQRKKKFTKRCK
jgi:hypothetical protein